MALGQPDKTFDLKALREITDGDAVIEKQLAQLFCKTAESCIARLQALVMAGEGDQWHLLMHEFKGAALNLHADELAALCSVHEKARSPQERMGALMEIKKTYSALTPLLAAL